MFPNASLFTVSFSGFFSKLVFFLFSVSLPLNYFNLFSLYINALIVIVFLYSLFKVFFGKSFSLSAFSWFVFLLLGGVYFLVFHSGNKDAYSMMGPTVLVSANFFVFFLLGKKTWVGDDFMRSFFYVVLSLAVFLHIGSILSKQDLTGQNDVVVNTSYIFSYLIPFVFFVKNRFKELIVLALISVMLVIGAKRGAMLVGFLGVMIWFVYSFINLRGGFSGLMNRGFYLLLVVFPLMSAFLYFFSSYGIIYSRLIALTQGEGGSGRSEMYQNVFHAWLNSDSVFNLIFGFGYAASRSFTGNGLYAHNDWLESLINFGFLGFLVYLVFWLICLKVVFFNKLGNRLYNYQLFSVVAICLLATMFSMVYSAYGSASYAMGLLGYLLGKNLKAPSGKISL